LIEKDEPTDTAKPILDKDTAFEYVRQLESKKMECQKGFIHETAGRQPNPQMMQQMQ